MSSTVSVPMARILAIAAVMFILNAMQSSAQMDVFSCPFSTTDFASFDSTAVVSNCKSLEPQSCSKCVCSLLAPFNTLATNLAQKDESKWCKDGGSVLGMCQAKYISYLIETGVLTDVTFDNCEPVLDIAVCKETLSGYWAWYDNKCLGSDTNAPPQPPVVSGSNRVAFALAAMSVPLMLSFALG